VAINARERVSDLDCEIASTTDERKTRKFEELQFRAVWNYAAAKPGGVSRGSNDPKELAVSVTAFNALGEMKRVWGSTGSVYVRA
jgi:hypothetical protein